MAVVKATGGFDFNADPLATDTVTIGDQTYTYIATVASADDVAVGADRDESISNLVAAINGGAGAGTAYHADTVESPFVRASADLTADEIDLVAKVPGTIGNGIALSTSETDIIVTGSATLMAGGTGSLEAELEGLQLNSATLALFQELFRDG